MAYLDQRKFTENTDYQIRIKMAVLKASCAIVSENTSALTVTEATKRYNLAIAALMGGEVNGVTRSPSEIEDRFLWACAAYYDTKDLEDDVKVDIAVSSLWNGLAGIKLADKT